MTVQEIHQRLDRIEGELQRLKERVAGKRIDNSWIEATAGSFANDPLFDEAARLGRVYRKSTRPRNTKAGKKASRKS